LTGSQSMLYSNLGWFCANHVYKIININIHALRGKRNIVESRSRYDFSLLQLIEDRTLVNRTLQTKA